MADLLREKLRALVEEWQQEKGKYAILRSLTGTTGAYLLGRCADQLIALLAESEPEPERKEP